MRTVGLVFAAWLTAAAPAWAQREGALDVLLAMDRNGDGAVTRAEAQAARAAMFDRLDADDDGYLTETERSAGGDRMRRGMARADADNDGRISRAEAMGQPYRGFDRVDRDHDGVISAQEIETVRALMGGG